MGGVTKRCRMNHERWSGWVRNSIEVQEINAMTLRLLTPGADPSHLHRLGAHQLPKVPVVDGGLPESADTWAQSSRTRSPTGTLHTRQWIKYTNNQHHLHHCLQHPLLTCTDAILIMWWSTAMQAYNKTCLRSTLTAGSYRKEGSLSYVYVIIRTRSIHSQN